MSELRFRVVESAFHVKAKEVAVPTERPSEYFGKYVFNREKMFKYLSSTVYAKLVDAMDMVPLWIATLPTRWLRA